MPREVYLDVKVGPPVLTDGNITLTVLINYGYGCCIEKKGSETAL